MKQGERKCSILCLISPSYLSQKLLRTKDALRRIDESILDGIVGGGGFTNLYGGNDDDL